VSLPFYCSAMRRVQHKLLRSRALPN
jgi:hypothetical protein